MAEQIQLATPETKPAIVTTTYRPVFVSFDSEAPAIVIRLRGTNGEVKSFVYGGSDAGAADKTKAATLIKTINKSNLSTKSMDKRIMEQLMADFPELAGTITGAPE
jgi:hypothetical protein